MKFPLRTAAVCMVALATGAFAQSATEETAQGDVSITIYNNDVALVQDVRQLPIANGRSRIEFPDVSARIRPETLSFNAADTSIIEQNFDFDLLTPQKMMEKAIGQTVTLVRTNPATGVETRERAEVLSTAGGVVVKIGSRIEVLRDDGLPVRVVFDRVPPNLRARPTLSVNVDSNRAGTRPAQIRYLTAGLGWSSDYVALYDEARGTIDMQGWVTLTNATGTTFSNADTLLVAGSPGQGRRGYGGYDPALRKPGTETADRERLGDYYLYPISGRTTIANNQTKQVSFLDVQGVKAAKVYSRELGWLVSDSSPQNVASMLEFSTSRDQGLGDALPAGAVRFYQRDSKGSPQFIGESTIGHTPMGSTLRLQTGAAFDIFMQSEVEKRDAIKESEWESYARYRVIKDDGTISTYELQEQPTYYRTTMRYTFTNAKDVPVDVQFVQGGLDRGWWSRDFRIISEDIPGEQLNTERRKYVVTVPANGTREIRVTYATRY